MMMVVLVGMAALVLDLGVGREKKRQIQNAVDAAALGAAQDLPSLGTADSRAKSLVATNLSGAIPAWGGCTDSSALPVTLSTPCISYDSSFTQVRVRAPTQSVPTAFAPVFGIQDMKVSAAAVAQLVNAGLGTLQPFALYAGSGAEACLKTGGQTPDPICNNTTGNFGTLDISMYGNAAMQTQARCGSSQQAARLQNNIGIGIDHVVTVYQGSETRDGCGNAGPNTLQTRTGDAVSDFDIGMLHGGASVFDDAQPARLQRGSNVKATAAGTQIDNLPLWRFIPSGTVSGVPPSCQRSVFDNLVATTPSAQQPSVLHTALGRCITDYNAGTGCGGACTAAVFTANTTGEQPLDLFDIQLSPRFVYVPKFAQTTPPNGASYLHVTGFQPVFLQRLYASCTANRCSTDFEPGPWNTSANGSSNDNANAITGFVINPRMLPGETDRPFVVGQTAYVQLIL